MVFLWFYYVWRSGQHWLQLYWIRYNTERLVTKKIILHQQVNFHTDTHARWVYVCVPVGFVVVVDSSKTLAPSDGSGGEASDWANGQGHGGERSGWTPYSEQRKRLVTRLVAPQHWGHTNHVFLLCHPSHTHLRTQLSLLCTFLKTFLRSYLYSSSLTVEIDRKQAKTI